MAQILDISTENFNSAVMEASKTRAVVLSFSSSQFPDCAKYDALLEKLSSELDFTLGKVNLDKPENEEFIGMFRIRSLPQVAVINKGDIADMLQGALPEKDLKERLSKYFISDEARAQMAIEDAIAAGKFKEAVSALEAATAAKPEDKKLRLLLAEAELGCGNGERAKEILKKFQTGDEGYDKAKSLLELMDFAIEAAKPEPEGKEAKMYHSACTAASKKDYGTALETLLGIVYENASWNSSAASKAMLTLFGVLGPKHELTWKYRSKLNTALFI